MPHRSWLWGALPLAWTWVLGGDLWPQGQHRVQAETLGSLTKIQSITLLLPANPQRWFLYPPEKTPEFHPNKTTLAWLQDTYPALTPSARPLECTIQAGEVSGWQTGQAEPGQGPPSNPSTHMSPQPLARCCISRTDGGMPHSTSTPASSSLPSSASQRGWLASPPHTSTHPCSTHRFYYRDRGGGSSLSPAQPHPPFLAQKEDERRVAQQN